MEKKFDGMERELRGVNGFLMVLGIIVGFIVSVALFIVGTIWTAADGLVGAIGGWMIFLGIVGFVLFCIMCGGFHVINPNEAMVFTLFGKYYGTLKREGFYYIHPLTTAATLDKGKKGASDLARKKISLKTMTLNNNQQKVNDALGNPIIIGAIVIWRVVDPTKAMFNVDNYNTYLSIQCDSTIRNISRLYPYDLMEEDDEEGHEKTLRGSSQEIAESMKLELGERVAVAGIEVEEVRITHLSYAEEIAAAMLQKQQAAAVIAARRKIVEGAVGMVDMAIEELGAKEVVVLDEERKAAMVSNLLVVLCGHQEAQPIVNSGSIY